MTEDALDRLVRELSRLNALLERQLAAENSQHKRSLKKAAPTTEDAIAEVRSRLRKVRGA